MIFVKSELSSNNRSSAQLGQLDYGQRISKPNRLLKGKEAFPKRKIRFNRNKCYTEYFVAQRSHPLTGGQETVAELVAENVSNNIVLLAHIATRPEARCGGIGSALLKYFRETVSVEKPDATIFLEVEDPDADSISEAEQHIRRRRLNWYLRAGAVMWSGYYEIANALDKRMRGSKAIFMALPRPFETISYEQLQEAALEVLKISYGTSSSHWLYKKVQRQSLPAVCQQEDVATANLGRQMPSVEARGVIPATVGVEAVPAAGADLGTMPDIAQTRGVQERSTFSCVTNTICFLKTQLRYGTKYGVRSPEEAINKYLEQQALYEGNLLSAAENNWQMTNFGAFNHAHIAEQVNG